MKIAELKAALSREKSLMQRAAMALNAYAKAASDGGSKVSWARLKDGYTILFGVSQEYDAEGRMLILPVFESSRVVARNAADAVVWALRELETA